MANPKTNLNRRPTHATVPPAHIPRSTPDIASYYHFPAEWPEAMRPLHTLCVGAFFTCLEAADFAHRHTLHSPCEAASHALWEAHALHAYDLWRAIEFDAQAALADMQAETLVALGGSHDLSQPVAGNETPVSEAEGATDGNH